MADIKQCDVRGCQAIEGVERIIFVEGRRQDAVGDMEDFGLTVDLCPKHQGNLLDSLCEDCETSKRAAEIVRGWIKK